MSAKSVIKGLRKSDATIVPPLDIVKLNFGQLIDLSLGQTEDSRNYGAVSFGLLRELLLAIVDRMGVRNKVALAYDSSSPPEAVSAANSPMNSLHEVPPLKAKSREISPLKEEAAEPKDSKPNSPPLPPTSPESEIALKLAASSKTGDKEHEIHTPQQQKSGPVGVRGAVSTPDTRQRSDPLMERLVKLEQQVLGLSRNTLDLQRKDEHERDDNDIETRIVNIEHGMTLMTGIVEKIKDKVNKLNRKIDLTDQSDNESPAPKRKPTKRRQKKIDQPDFDEAAEEGDLEYRDHMTSVTPTPDVEITVNEPKSKSQEAVEKEIRKEKSPAKMAVDQEYLDNIAADLQYYKDRVEGLDEAFGQHKRSADRLKKLAISGLDNVDNQLSGCVTWDQLEKHINSKKSGLEPSGGINSGLSDLLVAFAHEELQNQLGVQAGRESLGASSIRTGTGAGGSESIGLQNSGINSATHPGSMMNNQLPHGGHGQTAPSNHARAHTGAQPGQPQGLNQPGSSPQQGSPTATNQSGASVGQGPHKQGGSNVIIQQQPLQPNTKSKQVSPGATQGSVQVLPGSTTQGLPGSTQGQPGSMKGSPSSTQGQPGSTHGPPGSMKGSPSSTHGQPGSNQGQPGSTQGQPGSTQGLTNSGLVGQGISTPQSPSPQLPSSPSSVGKNSSTHPSKQKQCSSHATNQPVAQQTQGIQNQPQFKGVLPGSSMATQHGTMMTSIAATAGGMKLDSKPVIPQETGSRNSSQGSQGSQTSHQHPGPGGSQFRGGSKPGSVAEFPGYRYGHPSHTSGAGQRLPVAPPGQMQEWQDRLGRLMSEAESSDMKRPGPSSNLRKTLESLADVTQKHETLGGIVDLVNQQKADKIALQALQDATEDKLNNLEELLKQREDELIAFRELVQHVSANKVDRDYLTFAVSMKADKKDVADMIDTKYFNHVTKSLAQSIDDVKTRVKTVEQTSSWKETVDKLLQKLNHKADKEDMLAIKKIIQSFDAKLHELTIKDSAQHQNDEAAAFRKQMIPWNCLSCTKTVHMDGNKMPTSLPLEPGVSGFKTSRPYTAYELKSIREQFQDRSDDRYADIYSQPRPTGGAFTMVDPLKHLRNNRNAAVQDEVITGRPSPSPTGGNPYPTINIYNHTVIGHDGKIYKGVHQDKLPDIIHMQNARNGLTDPSPSTTHTQSLAANPSLTVTKSPSM